MLSIKYANCIYFAVQGCTKVKRNTSLEVDDVKETSEIVCTVLQSLIKLHGDIVMGAVTENEIREYKEKGDNLQCLYEAAKAVSSMPRYDQVFNAIKVCDEKLKAVKKYRQKLKVLVYYCKQISEGM